MATRARRPQGRVFLSGGFPAGTKVELFERRGDVFSPALPVVASATVGEDSTVEFRKLAEGKSFWVAAEVEGDWRPRAVTAKEQPGAKQRDEFRNEDSASLRFQREAGHTTSGVRTTVSSRVRGHVKHPDAPALEQDATFVGRQDGQVALGSDEAADVLASDTLQGLAVPADPGRPQQADVPEGVVQASSTEHGDASPLQTYEQQSDVPAGVAQSSSTEEGDASVIDADEARKVAEEQAPPGGLTQERVDELLEDPQVQKGIEAARAKLAEPAAKPKRKRSAKKSGAKKGGLTAAQRSARSRKAAATRKANAKKAAGGK